MSVSMIIFISIFIAIILALMIIAFYGSRKDKKGKTSALKSRKSKETTALIAHAKAYLWLDSVVEFVEEGQRKHHIDASSVSIGTINLIAEKAIIKISSSKDVKDIYKSEDKKYEFKPVLESLKNVKPVNWKKEAYFAVNLVKAKADLYGSKEEYEEFKKKISEHKWN